MRERLFASAPMKVEAVYEAPYLSHAPMEPLNAVVLVRPDGLRCVGSTQIQSAAAGDRAMVTGLPAEKVQIPHQYLGGGFGRRGGADYVGERSRSQGCSGDSGEAHRGRAKTICSTILSPGFLREVRAGLDADGWPRIAERENGLSAFRGTEHVGRSIQDTKYAIANVQMDYTRLTWDSGELLAVGRILAEYVLHGELRR